MPKENNLRVVIDTNLLLSAVITPKGFPNKVIRAWQKDLFTLIISGQLLEEIEEVFKRDIFNKYEHFLDWSEELITNLKLAAEIITPMSEDLLPLHSRDLKDDKLLACALGGDCDYLITGDEDLLVLKNHNVLGNLKIVTVNEFLLNHNFRLF